MTKRPHAIRTTDRTWDRFQAISKANGGNNEKAFTAMIDAYMAQVDGPEREAIETLLKVWNK